ncbi:PDZ domain-containing protein [Rubinisphaera margarita]|uniref:PDZ domain-containing protein n=1 Tax=Rubinisphaera margarita TaxID=2909586 RepID=UPI001EE8C7B4|nr:PDZ domain-containing protein [Rubinisphaera margarita]MCG6158605.1 PDZ domain-containing protein [Rubinisphaera margarita]
MSQRFALTLIGLSFGLIVSVAPARVEAKDLDITLTRHGELLKLAFREVVADAAHLAIEAEINEAVKAPGTLVDSRRGICVVKASSLGEFASRSDAFRCRLSGNRWQPARFLHYEKSQDLVYLRCEMPEDWSSPPIEYLRDMKPGQWVVSLRYADELPLGVGVLGALPRKIASSSGYVGLTVDQADGGLTVKEVFANSGASRAGLKSGDIILDDENEPVTKRRRLSQVLAELEPGDWFLLSALRDGEPVTFDIRVGTSWNMLVDRQEMMNRFGSDVSARRSGFRSALQHDTLLHPDECGGPLVSLDGKLIGANIARAGRTDTLTVPIEDILSTIEEISLD